MTTFIFDDQKELIPVFRNGTPQFAEMILRGSVAPISHEECPIGSFCRRGSRNRFCISSPARKRAFSSVL